MQMQKTTEMSITNKFTQLFSELEDFNEDEQKQKIEEMNGLMDEMDRDELLSVCAKELFNKIHKMIEEKRIDLENALKLLKHMGYCSVLKNLWNLDFIRSSLRSRFEKIIISENEKIEEKNEKLLVDLCECYLLLNDASSSDLVSISIPCLLKFALNEKENEEAQKEVEMVLLALSYINSIYKIKKEKYLNEIKEIIQYHQENRNLTQLAYQSAWGCLMNRFGNENCLGKVIVNELHFEREATRELEQLMHCVNWRRKKEERGKEAKESKKIRILVRWLHIINFNFFPCARWNEEYSGLVNSIVQVFRAAKHNYTGICGICTFSLMYVASNSSVKIEDLLKSGAVDAVLEEIQRPTLNDHVVNGNAQFFMNVSIRLKKKGDVEKEEAKRKVFSKIIEKMEEEGYEDVITSFCELLHFLKKKKYYCGLSFDISDYFVNA
ncbi:uncharacterized protein MONOS_11676 [Monocercomonoides exilis]|uniref:uncharacterized protein n=1 Tax=Monocercomonoides exilis TaxID=2049356 RepID=UPI0035593AA8|nr:hypothetical protein MONOS_11676 [Monocercomonoides exilis]